MTAVTRETLGPEANDCLNPERVEFPTFPCSTLPGLGGELLSTTGFVLGLMSHHSTRGYSSCSPSGITTSCKLTPISCAVI